MACNKSGRPKNETLIRFGQQPVSIISKLLKTIKKNESNLSPIDVELKQENECVESLESPNLEFVEPDQSGYILCQNCSHRSSSMKDHQQHAKLHKEKTFSCEYPNCRYTSKVSSNLIKHKRIHTSEKPYLCDQCSFRSNFINSLKVHRRIHTDERPYNCNYCSYRCNSSSNLKKHCKHRHGGLTPN